MLLDKEADTLDRAGSLRNQGRGHLPHMPHALPDLERHLHTGFASAFGELPYAPKEQFIGSYLDEQRRKAAQVRIKWRKQWLMRVMRADIGIDQLPQRVASYQRVPPATRPVSPLQDGCRGKTDSCRRQGLSSIAQGQ